jgi:hypothetical protein
MNLLCDHQQNIQHSEIQGIHIDLIAFLEDLVAEVLPLLLVICVWQLCEQIREVLFVSLPLFVELYD